MAFRPKNGKVTGTDNDDSIIWQNSSPWKKSLTVDGLAGNDVINFKSSSYKNNKLFGRAGNDTINGGKSADSIDGASGNDKLYGNGGNDTIKAGYGNDYIVGGKGNDKIYLQKGKNTVVFNSGDGKDTIYKGQGTFTSDIVKFNNFANFNALVKAVKAKMVGFDLVINYTSKDSITLANFFKTNVFTSIKGVKTRDNVVVEMPDFLKKLTFNTFSGKTKVKGTATNDLIIGTNRADTLNGAKGNDVIRGNDGEDRIHGNEDNDSIDGGKGTDHIYGDSGNDTLKGGDGTDTIFGGSGNDEIRGGAHADHLHGDSGKDIIYGDGGRDNLWGEAGDDILYGGADNDTIKGGAGNDKLYGGDGDDNLYGGDENGGSGNDTLIGGKGDDKYLKVSLSDFTTIIDTQGTNDSLNISANKSDIYFLFNVNNDGTFSDGNDRLAIVDKNTFDSWKTTGVVDKKGVLIEDFDSIEKINANGQINTAHLNALKGHVAAWLAENGGGYADVQSAITSGDDVSGLVAIFTDWQSKIH